MFNIKTLFAKPISQKKELLFKYLIETGEIKFEDPEIIVDLMNIYMSNINCKTSRLIEKNLTIKNINVDLYFKSIEYKALSPKNSIDFILAINKLASNGYLYQYIQELINQHENQKVSKENIEIILKLMKNRNFEQKYEIMETLILQNSININYKIFELILNDFSLNAEQMRYEFIIDKEIFNPSKNVRFASVYFSLIKTIQIDDLRKKDHIINYFIEIYPSCEKDQKIQILEFFSINNNNSVFEFLANILNTSNEKSWEFQYISKCFTNISNTTVDTFLISKIKNSQTYKQDYYVDILINRNNRFIIPNLINKIEGFHPQTNKYLSYIIKVNQDSIIKLLSHLFSHIEFYQNLEIPLLIQAAPKEFFEQNLFQKYEFSEDIDILSSLVERYIGFDSQYSFDKISQLINYFSKSKNQLDIIRKSIISSCQNLSIPISIKQLDIWFKDNNEIKKEYLIDLVKLHPNHYGHQLLKLISVDNYENEILTFLNVDISKNILSKIIAFLDSDHEGVLEDVILIISNNYSNDFFQYMVPLLANENLFTLVSDILFQSGDFGKKYIVNFLKAQL